jgi:hypothetical protein
LLHLLLATRKLDFICAGAGLDRPRNLAAKRHFQGIFSAILWPHAPDAWRTARHASAAKTIALRRKTFARNATALGLPQGIFKVDLIDLDDVRIDRKEPPPQPSPQAGEGEGQSHFFHLKNM